MKTCQDCYWFRDNCCEHEKYVHSAKKDTPSCGNFEAIKKELTAHWHTSITLDVECPYCYELFDASNQMEGEEIGHSWENRIVKCEYCKKRFVIDEIQGEE